MKIVNRQARRNYHILDRLEAGIALTGAEVKSIRAGRIDLSVSFVKIVNGQAQLLNANIPRYQQTTPQGYDPLRSRKLLLHKSQIQSLLGKVSGRATTLVPLAVYEKNNRFKIEVGLGKSKREFDKRRVLKEKDHQRRLQQELRGKE